jgi:SAM-dependent methyltransferase
VNGFFADAATDSSAQSFYDLIGPIYDSHWGRGFLSSAASLFDQHAAPRIPAGGQILDLCCGSGSFVGYLARKGYRVTGVDSSPVLLAEAAEHTPQARLVCADMSAFALPENFAGAVCWYNSLNHVRDEREVEQIFRCVARHLTHAAPFLFDVILEEDYLRSWTCEECVLSADRIYELIYRYRAQERIAECQVRVRSRRDPKYVEAEAISEQRPICSRTIQHALRRAGFRVVLQKTLETGHPPDGRLVVLAERL